MLSALRPKGENAAFSGVIRKTLRKEIRFELDFQRQNEAFNWESERWLKKIRFTKAVENQKNQVVCLFLSNILILDPNMLCSKCLHLQMKKGGNLGSTVINSIWVLINIRLKGSILDLWLKSLHILFSSFLIVIKLEAVGLSMSGSLWGILVTESLVSFNFFIMEDFRYIQLKEWCNECPWAHHTSSVMNIKHSMEFGPLLTLSSISSISLIIEKCSKYLLVAPYLWLVAGISYIIFV